MVLVGGAFGRWLGHEGEALKNGISVPMKEILQSELLRPEREPSPNHAGTRILDFQPPELWEMNFCCL